MAILPKPSESQGDFTLPDPGMYTVELISYDGPEQSMYDAEKSIVWLEFNILNDEDFQGTTIKQLYGWSMHPTMSKLYPVIKALNGGTYDDDAELDLDDLVGNRMMATVEHVEKASKNNPGETRTFARITGAAPIRRKKTKPAPQAKPKAVEADENPYEDDEDDDAVWDQAS